MNKDEAINQMLKGVKITHSYFSHDEWMTIEGNKIIFEDGCRCSQNEFWSYRTTGWKDGYSIYKP